MLVQVIPAVSITCSGGSDGAGDLDFGLVSPGNNGTTATINANTGTGAGFYVIGGGAGMGIKVTFTSPSVTLSDSTGDQLTYTPQMVGAQQLSSQVSAAAISSGSQVTLSTAGNYYLWLGGTVFVPAGQNGGTYKGLLSITVSY